MVKTHNLGVTATRKGITPQQEDALEAFLRQRRRRAGLVLHHGASPVQKCGDWQADRLARTLGIKVVKHPPDKPITAKTLLSRNRVMVDLLDELVALPGGYVELQRSGTWMTVRRAWYRNLDVRIIFPDGSTEES